MTISELCAQTGATDDRLMRYYTQTGDHRVTSWTGEVNGKRGWWWAITSVNGITKVVAMGWSSGLRARDRDADIAAKIAGLQTPARELAS